jgi:hypothetical protein
LAETTWWPALRNALTYFDLTDLELAAANDLQRLFSSKI